MAIRKYKPTTPGRRGSSVADFAEITRSTPEKSLLRPLSKTGGRNNQGRITTHIENGKLNADLGVPPFNREEDRIMICGSPEMLKSIKAVLEARGFNEGNTTTPGDFVVERAFVEQ